VKEIVFKSDCFLKKTCLDQYGAKQVTFEFTISNTMELAKLELMARDLENFRPNLLEMRVRISPNYGKDKGLRKVNYTPEQKRSIGGRKSSDS